MKKIPPRMFPDGRGGSKHKPAPLVDESRIAVVLGKHKDLVADMKQYENVGRSQNPNGPGLMLLFDFLSDLIALSPSALLPPAATKMALMTLLVNNPKMNSTPYNSGVWVGARLERITTLMYHLRKLKREDSKLRQVAYSLNGEDLAKLTDLLESFQLEPEGDEGIASTVLCSDRSTVQSIDEACAPRRLKRMSSDISLDEHGFPKFLGNSPVASSSAKGRLKRVSSDVSLDEEGYPKFLRTSPKNSEAPATQQSSSASTGHPTRITGKTSPAVLATRGSPANGSPPVSLDGDGYPILQGWKSPAPASKPAGAKAKAKAKPVTLREPSSDIRCPVPHKSEHYSKMWYKQCDSVGIRDKATDKQIFSFGLRGYPDLRYELELIAIKAMEQLEKGKSAEAVKQWAIENANAIPR